MEIGFYVCNTCGNHVTMIQDSGANPVCCGERMEKLKSHTNDFASEKHVPEVRTCCGSVQIKIGSESHPMEDKHFIEWVCIETDKGVYVRTLGPGDKPIVTVNLGFKEKVKNVYAYCNVHGLWLKSCD
ncbi:MAG: desulfoferrodoxin Dfx [Clostridia bacterium]|nr:desulfoferrodoxin Dfx [Clostridia bacterium]